MSFEEIKQLINGESGKLIIVEEGRPVAVVMNFEEYKRTLKKNDFPGQVSFPTMLQEPKAELVKGSLPLELQKEELKIVDVQRQLAQRQVLSNNQVRETAQICLKVEETFNYPQDIEWCISEGELWLLQSRPITGKTK